MNRNILYRRRFLTFVVVCAGLYARREAAAQTRLNLTVRGDVVFGSHRVAPGVVGFSPDSRLLSLPCDDHRIMLWDLCDSKELGRLERPGGQKGSTKLNVTCFLGDGRTLAADFWSPASSDPRGAELVLFDVATRAARATIPFGGPFGPRAIAFSPDGTRALIGLKLLKRKPATEVTLWDLETATPIKKLDTAPQCESVAISPDGKWLATVHGQSDGKGQVVLWDAGTLRRHRVLRADGGWLTLAFSPDSKLIAAGAGRHMTYPLDYFSRVWNVESGVERGPVQADVGDERKQWNIHPLFSPDSQSLISMCTSRHTSLPRKLHLPGKLQSRLELSDVASGEQRTLTRGTGWGLPWITCADFSPDGAVLATAAFRDRTEVTLWDTKYWREIRRLDMSKNSGGSSADDVVGWLRFSPDGKWLAALRAKSDWSDIIDRSQYEVVIWKVSEALAGTSESQSPGMKP